jgi:thioredoxin reductase
MVSKKKNVELVPFIQILSVSGKDHLEQLSLLNLKTNVKTILKTDGLFVELGYVVNSNFVKDLVDLNEIGAIIVNSDQSTSQAGVFAAGDVTDRPY